MDNKSPDLYKTIIEIDTDGEDDVISGESAKDNTNKNCKSSNQTSDFSQKYAQKNWQDKETHCLRLRASDIAAISGYNPFKDVLDLVMEYLYQDIPYILDQDAKLLSLEIVDKETELQQIVSKTGKETEKVIAEACKNIKDGKKLKSTEDVSELNIKVMRNHNLLYSNV